MTYTVMQYIYSGQRDMAASESSASHRNRAAWIFMRSRRMIMCACARDKNVVGKKKSLPGHGLNRGPPVSMEVRCLNRSASTAPHMKYGKIICYFGQQYAGQGRAINICEDIVNCCGWSSIYAGWFVYQWIKSTLDEIQMKQLYLYYFIQTLEFMDFRSSYSNQCWNHPSDRRVCF